MVVRLCAFFFLTVGAASAMATPQVTSFASQAEAIVDRLTQPTGPGASVTVTRNGQVIYQAARGEASVELHVPMKPGNILRIGSITKTVTAATLLTLVHQGKLSLSDPISRFLPDFPEGSTITIAQLLSHTAGISDAWNADPTQPLDAKTLVALIAKQSLDFNPGSEWRYSNSGYMLLGAVIEKVTGKPWRDAMAELVLAPFGMTHTDYFADDVVVPGAAQGYSADVTGKTTRPPFASITGPMTACALTSTSQDIAQLSEGTDYFHVVKGADGRATAVEFFTDGMAPPRTERRAKDSP
jgi:CubicO group peptidase (beta-lactamase class C family)